MKVPYANHLWLVSSSSNMSRLPKFIILSGSCWPESKSKMSANAAGISKCRVVGVGSLAWFVCFFRNGWLCQPDNSSLGESQLCCSRFPDFPEWIQRRQTWQFWSETCSLASSGLSNFYVMAVLVGLFQQRLARCMNCIMVIVSNGQWRAMSCGKKFYCLHLIWVVTMFWTNIMTVSSKLSQLKFPNWQQLKC